VLSRTLIITLSNNQQYTVQSTGTSAAPYLDNCCRYPRPIQKVKRGGKGQYEAQDAPSGKFPNTYTVGGAQLDVITTSLVFSARMYCVFRTKNTSPQQIKKNLPNLWVSIGYIQWGVTVVANRDKNTKNNTLKSTWSLNKTTSSVSVSAFSASSAGQSPRTDIVVWQGTAVNTNGDGKVVDVCDGYPCS
jgi:hypothetical protein